jgi:hypothetical protein
LSTSSLILDYASPRKRGRLRLPSRSVLDVVRDEPGRVLVIEKLKGKGEAIGAIAFALFMLVYMAALMWAQWKYGAQWVLGPFWIIEAILIVLVVHQTWRKTTFSATGDQIRLNFRSPIWRRAFAWRASDVIDVASVVTGDSRRSRRAVAELRVRFVDGRELRLFTDHPQGEIDELAAAIRDVLLQDARRAA